MAFYVQKVLGSDEGGFIRLFSTYVEKFPIPAANDAARSALGGLVEKCLAARGQGPQVAAWESEINAHVFRLYGLTKDEIKIVEQAAQWPLVISFGDWQFKPASHESGTETRTVARTPGT
jgi:hypothetical protein